MREAVEEHAAARSLRNLAYSDLLRTDCAFLLTMRIRRGKSLRQMARVNISIPADLAPLVSKWRRKINLSEICAGALRSELQAVESHRSARPLLRALRKKSPLEQQVAERFNLREAWVSSDAPEDEGSVREVLGELAADYLDRNLSDGCVLAIGGGRQSWCVVEHMRPRQIDVDVVALGYRQADPHLLNVHPNTLVTILWILFSPRARAWLVGNQPADIFDLGSQPRRSRSYFVVGSCSSFNRESGLARLIGPGDTKTLLSQEVTGDFLYNFFDSKGQIVDFGFSAEQSTLSASELRYLSGRDDSRVVLVGGGKEKAATIKKTLEAGLCNVLVTETAMAQALVKDSSTSSFARRSSRSSTRPRLKGSQV
jgi:DNA-binding transcriptional regulator LsrR (DeoR family)